MMRFGGSSIDALEHSFESILGQPNLVIADQSESRHVCKLAGVNDSGEHAENLKARLDFVLTSTLEIGRLDL